MIASAPTLGARSDRDMSARYKVYIVEDSPILQRMLVTAIGAAGAEVSGCSADAEEAIAEVFALQPDLIVIDISLPAGSGFDVLRALQEHALVPGAIKVVLTNHANQECRDFSFRLGADRFYDKSLESSQALAFIAAKAAERRASAISPEAAATV